MWLIIEPVEFLAKDKMLYHLQALCHSAFISAKIPRNKCDIVLVPCFIYTAVNVSCSSFVQIPHHITDSQKQRKLCIQRGWIIPPVASQSRPELFPKQTVEQTIRGSQYKGDRHSANMQTLSTQCHLCGVRRTEAMHTQEQGMGAGPVKQRKGEWAGSIVLLQSGQMLEGLHIYIRSLPGTRGAHAKSTNLGQTWVTGAWLKALDELNQGGAASSQLATAYLLH